jgi:aspartyl-tRNA(Asn)/glutamyl-tRNA(Gln) amidotransferase subunit C
MSDPGMENVDKIDVSYVAHLARLFLTSEEVRTFQGQLDHIVGYVRKINELDLKNVEPTSYAVTVQNVFREDVLRPGLSVEQAMTNAPVSTSDQFQVPKIVE